VCLPNDRMHCSFDMCVHTGVICTMENQSANKVRVRYRKALTELGKLVKQEPKRMIMTRLLELSEVVDNKDCKRKLVFACCCCNS
jgi:hypothetical protein